MTIQNDRKYDINNHCESYEVTDSSATRKLKYIDYPKGRVKRGLLDY